MSPHAVPTDPAAEAGSRRRHPSARAAGGHLLGPLRRLAAALPEPQGPHWEVAFAVLAVRGGQARSRTAFAAAYGITVEQVAALERGDRPLAAVPPPLRTLTALDALVRELRAAA